MKKKRTIVFVVQLVLTIGFAFSFYTYSQNEVKPTKVYVYSEDLNVKDAVKVGVKEIPLKAVQKDMVTVKEMKKAEVEKKFAGYKVGAGQFVYQNQLAKEGDIDPFETMDLSKYRKVSLPISYVSGFGGDIKRGDKVDLIFTGQGKKKEVQSEQNFQYSKAFLQDVLVYNVTDGKGFKFQNHSTSGANETGKDGQKLDTTASSEEMKVITLAVTLDQAEEISARKSVGDISFASRFKDNQSYETLGYVLGDYDKVYSAPVNAETGRTVIGK